MSDSGRTILVNPLNHGDVLSKVTIIKQSLLSSYGPSGRIKICGQDGSQETTVGSSSNLLINSALFEEIPPALKLFFAAVKEHLKVHYDFGLFCLIFSLSLIEAGIKSGIPQCTVAKCYRYFLQEILKEDTISMVTQKIDISKIFPLMNLVSGILKSKPILLLNSEQTDHLSSLLIKVFLRCMPTDCLGKKLDWPVLHFQHKSHFEQSKVFDGVLLKLSHHTDESLREMFRNFNKSKELNVILLDVTIEVGSLKNNTSVSDKSLVSNTFLENFILKFGEDVLSAGIKVVFNQKNICDSLKHFFLQHNILVLDRIGLQSISSLQKISKTRIMGFINDDVTLCKGSIDGISLAEVGKTLYVHVTNNSVPLSSLVVGIQSEMFLPDLKHVCWASINAIDATLRLQKVLVGGGKLELLLSQHLKTHFSNVELLKPICPPGQFKACLEGFCKVLSTLGTGLESNDEIYDAFDAKLNALVVAIQTAAMVLEIQFQIIG